MNWERNVHISNRKYCELSTKLNNWSIENPFPLKKREELNIYKGPIACVASAKKGREREGKKRKFPLPLPPLSTPEAKWLNSFATYAEHQYYTDSF